MLLILLLAIHLLAAVFWVGGMAGATPYVHAMATTGLIMMALYLHLWFAPWRRFRAALDKGDLPEAARRLNQIRIIVGINLLLGALTLIIGGTGRFW